MSHSPSTLVLTLVVTSIVSATSVRSAGATTYLVRPDGLGDFPTIAAAIAAASDGDTIELGDGTFTGAGNRNLDFGGKQLVVRSQSGVADACIIDCQNAGRGFVFQSGETGASVVEGITIRRGAVNFGGAIYCRANSAPLISGCVFRDNNGQTGSAIACVESSGPTIRDCVIRNNFASSGGTFYGETGASPRIERCTFSANGANLGSGLYCRDFSSPIVEDCVFLDNTTGSALLYLRNDADPEFQGCTFANNTCGGPVVYMLNRASPRFTSCTIAYNTFGSNLQVIDIAFNCQPAFAHTIIAYNQGGDGAFDCSDPEDVAISCCDVFGNEGGDWTECTAGKLGVGGNISLDPLLCDAANDDFSLAENSPCASGNNTECGQIGAWPVGCGSACAIALSPARIATYAPCGGSFPVALDVDHVVELGSFEVCAGYDGTRLLFDRVTIDPEFLGSTGRLVTPISPVPCAPACQSEGILFGATTSGMQPGPSGSGRLATVYWEPLGVAVDVEDDLCLEGWQFASSGTPPESIVVSYAAGASLVHRSFCYGDFDDDGDVSIIDVMQVGSRWGSDVGESGYLERYDVNLLAQDNYCASSPDGSIDIADVQSVASRWGQGCGGGEPLAPDPIPDGILPGAEIAGVSPSTVLRIVPEILAITGGAGDTGVLTLEVEDALPLGAFEATLAFDPAVIQVADVEVASFLGSTGRAVYPLEPRIDNERGVVTLGAWTTGVGAGAVGTGALARVTVSIRSCPGESGVEIGDAVLTDARGWVHAIGGTEPGAVVTECDASSSPLPSDPVAYRLLPSRPNPFSRSTTISFAVPSSAKGGVPVELLITDASGRIVRRFATRECQPGVHEIVWDGRDERSLAAPNGAYFARLRAEGVELERQMVIVR